PEGLRLRIQAGQGRALHRTDGPRPDDGGGAAVHLRLDVQDREPAHWATVEDIEQTYLESWKLGLKCIAIYRDGCKRSQPLSTSLDKEKKAVAAAPDVEYRAMRRKLPDERKAVTHKFDIAGHEGYLTVGLYEDGMPGELFVTMAKEGSTISGLMDAFATQTSYALQFGVPLKFMVDKFSHMR